MNNDKKRQIKRLFDFSFPSDRVWNDWFFNKVYKEDEALTLEVEGKIVSSLFIQGYKFKFQNRETDFGYISGVMTDSHERHKGYMGTLLTQSINEAYRRGFTFVGLIPASRHLYFYYDTFGFATVVYRDVERFMSNHLFALTEGYSAEAPDFESFKTLEQQRETTIIHSEDDFENILHDIEHDGGTAIAIKNHDNRCVAMGFATTDSNQILVKELLGSDNDAIESALGALKDFFSTDLPMTVYRQAIGTSPAMRTYAMMRIVNVGATLDALAANNPDVSQIIKVKDSIVKENNNTYIIDKGKCIVDNSGKHKPTLDVSVDVLTKILFSTPQIGNIFGLPTSRPTISLMLD